MWVYTNSPTWELIGNNTPTWKRIGTVTWVYTNTLTRELIHLCGFTLIHQRGNSLVIIHLRGNA